MIEMDYISITFIVNAYFPLWSFMSLSYRKSLLIILTVFMPIIEVEHVARNLLQ